MTNNSEAPADKNQDTDSNIVDNKPVREGLVKAMTLSALLLGLFGIIGTFSVSSVYKLTAPTIEKNIQEKLLKTLGTVIPDQLYNNDLLASTIEVEASPLLGLKVDAKDKTIIYQAKLNDIVSAIAFKVTAPDGYSGNISILIGVLKNSHISAVRVISHKETPGLGDKVEVKRSNWIHGFKNTSLTSPEKDIWKVKKDGGHFDQFTGATITPRAVVKAVYQALNYVEQNRVNLFSLTTND